MCGIVGYVGNRNATPILIESLERLDYRGYDSAGIAVIDGCEVSLYKTAGSVGKLRQMIDLNKNGGCTGIGHTRWATHGKPSRENSHPHMGDKGIIAVVHNGIIENYEELKEELIGRGHVFSSETDTEVIPHLIEENYGGDLERAVALTLERLRGSYAIAVMCKDEPDKLVATTKDMPLVLGIGNGENYLASDVPAMLKFTNKVSYMCDEEIAVITSSSICIKNGSGGSVDKKIETVTWDAKAAEKAGYEHFMLKEIHEQPHAIRETLSGRISELEAEIKLKEIGLTERQINSISRVIITACGTSYYAAVLGRYLIEKIARIPAEAMVSSELRYGELVLDENTLVIAITQSGETADTIAALKEAKSHACHTMAIANVVGSGITRHTNNVLYTRAGLEICVAATKSFTSQIVALHLLALQMGRVRGTITPSQSKQIITQLRKLPGQVMEILEKSRGIEKVAVKYAANEHYFFIGRGINYPIAMEGALKLKEISYIHAEGYPAGELKHGPLALLTAGVPVVAISTYDNTYDKMLSNIKETKARGADVIAIADESDTNIEKYVDDVLRIPDTHEMLKPVLSAIVLQLLAYYTARHLGCEVDRPRNLAKSVTVE